MGPSGSDWTKLRQLGFKKAIAEYPGLKIVGEADGGYVRDKGLRAAQDLLTKFPDAKAIYGENEDMAWVLPKPSTLVASSTGTARPASSPSAPTAWSPAWRPSRPAN